MSPSHDRIKRLIVARCYDISIFHKIIERLCIMSDRRMSPRGFLAKSNSKAAYAAKGFLDAHREYLTTGEVGYRTSEIIARVDEGSVMPTPALDEIRQAVLAHILEVDRIKGEEALEAANDPKTPKAAKEGSKPKKAKKPFTACIRDGSGSVLIDHKGDEVKQSFDLPQRASEWCDRRLFEQSSDCFGEISCRDNHYEYVDRDQSLARILKTPKGAVQKHVKGSSSLSFGMKCKNDVAKFSRG